MISSAKKNPEQAQASNRILVGTKINGDINSDGDIRIDGVVKGNVQVAGKLVVGAHGSVEGEVECKNASISGKFKGTMRVSGLLLLSNSAKAEGQFVTDKLSIEPGAQFNGNCSMGAVVRAISSSEENESSAADNSTAQTA